MLEIVTFLRQKELNILSEYSVCGCTVDYKGLVVSSVQIVYASDTRIIALFPGKFHHFVK